MDAWARALDARMEWPRIVYEVRRVQVDRLEREVGEACRRHRAQPRDVAVGVVAGEERGAPGRLTVTTVVPGSDDGRPRDAPLSDVETLLADGARGGWRRLSCEGGPVEQPQDGSAQRP